VTLTQGEVMSLCPVTQTQGEAMSHCFIKTQDDEALSLSSVKTKIRRNYVALFHMVQTSIISN